MSDIEASRKKAFEDLREILDINEKGFAVRYYQCKTDDYVWKYADGAWEYKGNMKHDRILGRDCCPIDLVRKYCRQHVFAEPQTPAAPKYCAGEWEVKPSLPPTCQRVGSPIPGENDITPFAQQAGNSQESDARSLLASSEVWKRADEAYIRHLDESLKIVDDAQEECDRISKITKGLCK